MKDSSGVVIIFNPDVPSHLKEIETWYAMFISSQGLLDNQCLLIAHHKPGSGVEDERLSLGNPSAGHPELLYDFFYYYYSPSTNMFVLYHAASHLSRLPLVHSNLEEEPEDVRQTFCRYLGNVVNTMSESREREEMSIIT